MCRKPLHWVAPIKVFAEVVRRATFKSSLRLCFAIYSVTPLLDYLLKNLQYLFVLFAAVMASWYVLNKAKTIFSGEGPTSVSVEFLLTLCVVLFVPAKNT